MCFKSLTNKQKVYVEPGFARIYDRNDELRDFARTNHSREKDEFFPVKFQDKKWISDV